MLSVIPGTTSNDTQGALAILQTLSVDSRYKSRLEELQRQTKAANDAIDALRVAEQVAERKLAATDAMQASMLTEAQKVTAAADGLRAQAEARHAELAAREAALVRAKGLHEAEKKSASELWTKHKQTVTEELQAQRGKIAAEAEKLAEQKTKLVVFESELNSRKGQIDAANAKNLAEAKGLAEYRASLEAIVKDLHALTALAHDKVTDLDK